MLYEVLRSAAEAVPHQPLLVSPAGSLSYAECLDRTEAIARGLSRRSIPRFACDVADPGNLLPLLCASSAVGSEACVYPARLPPQQLADYASAFRHPVVVTDRTPPPGDPASVSLLALADDGGCLPPAPEHSPVLLLTTGTTGRPKGARHDWSRLVGSVRRPDERPARRWLLAYNLHQFAGVQVLVHVLRSRGTLVVPESRRPRDAVAAIHEHGVTHVSATPTFWRLLAGALDPVSARRLPLEQITLGGEAVPPDLPPALADLFPGARISQIYASTEFGSGVSVRDGRSGLPLSVLERDEDAEVQLRIVDGELQVRSRIGMLGYFGERGDEDGWRATGDLVEVRGDRIHFVGRTTETINVGGVKVHPLPIEEVVGAVEGVTLCRAYARRNPMSGQIVVLDVVVAPGTDTRLLDARIRAACEALPRASRPLRIRFVDALAVRGDKIDRRAAAP